MLNRICCNGDDHCRDTPKDAIFPAISPRCWYSHFQTFWSYQGWVAVARCYNPSSWMHPVLFTFCYCASGPNPGEKKVTPMNEYPCEANCCINSARINKEINSIKISVVFCRGCAHRWLCAQCQKPRGNRRNGPQRYPETRPEPDGEPLASVYDSLPKERKSCKGGVCSFLLGDWQEQGKKVSGMWV